MDLKNTVTYTLPPGGEQIGTTGVFVKGSFTVTYEYDLEDGKYEFDCAKIVSSNFTSSGGVGANTIYNNTTCCVRVSSRLNFLLIPLSTQLT